MENFSSSLWLSEISGYDVQTFAAAGRSEA